MENKNKLYFLLIGLLIVISLFTLVFVKDYTGQAVIEGKPGYIHEVHIDMRYLSQYWSGFYGISSRYPGYFDAEYETAVADEIFKKNNFFDCIDLNNGELFASTVPSTSIDWDSMRPGNITKLEEWIRISSVSLQSPTNTFLENITVVVGVREYTNVPGTFTKEYANATGRTFDLGYMTDDLGHHIFVTHLVGLKKGYNYNTSNYQMMVALPGNGSMRYYFFPDFYDDCPAGFGELPGNGTLQGYTHDNSTQLTIADVTVSTEGRSNVSLLSGFYNINDIPEGKHIVVAIKAGYWPYYKEVEINSNKTITLNISLIPVPDIVGEDGVIHGFVFDSDTLNTIANVTISAVGNIVQSDEYGEYGITAQQGSHTIVAIKEGYETYWGTVNVTAGNTTEFNITMTILKEVDEGVDDPGIGTGTGTGIGPGEGPGIGPGSNSNVDKGPYLEKPEPITGVDYWISIKELNKKIRVGNFAEDTIYLFSYKNGTIHVNFRIDGNVSELIELDKTDMHLAPDEGDEFTLTTYGVNRPGRYNGSLVFYGDIEESIPINIWITDEDKLPVEAVILDLEPLKRSVYAGAPFKYKVDIQNMLTELEYDVSLVYTVTDANNSKTEVIGYDDVGLQTSFSLIKNYPLPTNWPKGDYLLNVKANYLNLTSSATTIFTIVEPWYMYLVLGKIRLWILFVIIGSLLSLIFVGLFIKRRIEAKRRFHVKVDYAKLPKGGDRSLFAGVIAETEKRAYLDMDLLTVHTIVAGSTGGGKSIAAQDIVEECLLKDVAVVVFDPTAQWSGMLRKLKDKKLLGLYPKFGYKKKDAKAFPGNVKTVNNGRQIINIFDYMKPGEIQVFTTTKLQPKDYDIFVANMIRQIFQSNLEEYRGLRYLVVFDEIHRILPKFGGSGQGFVQIERACREFRKWGMGVLLISQVLQDFVGQIKANINTQIQMKTRDEGDLDAIKTKYGESYVQELVKSPVGSGMIQNSAYNNGVPYYITFRPILHSVMRLSDDELAQYNKYNEAAEQIQYELEQLEKKGLDVFDMKLELKLAVDKIKSGNFNMVDVYLEGLKPRIKKQFTRLNIKPKQKQIKLIDESELSAELKAAEEERAELQASEQTPVTAEKKEVEKVLLFEKQVDFSNAINFNNGQTCMSLQELLDVLQSMSPAIFSQHVNEEKNEVADWIQHKMGLKKLGLDLEGIEKKSEMVKRLEEEQQKNLKVENKPFESVEHDDKKKKAPPKKPESAKKDPEEETVKNEGKAATNQKIAGFNAFVKKAFYAAKEGKGKEALIGYAEVQKVFRTLPDNVRKQAYPICMDLYKKIKAFNYDR